MPWTHCQTELHDNQACTVCGFTKKRHTVRVGKTRTFTILRNAIVPGLKFKLVDERHRPLAGRRFRAESADGQQVVEGVLGADGSAEVPAWSTETAKLFLLDFDVSFFAWAEESGATAEPSP